MKGCGRSGGRKRKWTGGVKDVRTAGRIKESKDVGERNGERQRKKRGRGGQRATKERRERVVRERESWRG